MKKESTAVVVLSGGQDSTTCLFWAKKEYEKVCALTFDYGQKHRCELESAKKIAEIAKVPHQIFELQILKDLKGGGLSGMDINVSQAHPNAPELPASFVPGRNILFLTLAASYGFNLVPQSSIIVTGTCQTDFSGYPDCRREFIDHLENTLALGLYSGKKAVKILTPLMFLTKAEGVLLACKLGSKCWEALKYSHTCYNGKIPPCNDCPACKIRAKGFEKAGMLDPIYNR